VNFWRGLPFFAVTLFAGLVSIPEQLYEAAETDGATTVRKFWQITLPLLRPVMSIVILFSTIFTLADFHIVFGLTRAKTPAWRVRQSIVTYVGLIPLCGLRVVPAVHYARDLSEVETRD
jgi:ABC-type sugar transport system permease subunit